MKFIFIPLLLSSTMFAQPVDFEKRNFVDGNDVLPYRILLPEGYEKKKCPLIVFLHGSGERGNDNESQLVHGSKLFAADSNQQRFPAIVVFPQCPRGSTWARSSRRSERDSLGGLSFHSDQEISRPLQMVSLLIDSLMAEKIIDKRRVYIGGLSMGGMGTFEMLWRRPNLFAAAFPICGGGDPGKVDIYAKGFPIWIFHGDNDQSVPVANSRVMVAALRSAGAEVKYSEYPGVGHNSWDNAFAEPDLLKWLMSKKK